VARSVFTLTTLGEETYLFCIFVYCYLEDFQNPRIEIIIRICS